jgi:hypothetical protein
VEAGGDDQGIGREREGVFGRLRGLKHGFFNDFNIIK